MGCRYGKLTPFQRLLEQALKVDGLWPKKEQRTGLALYREIRAAGSAGGYSRVTDFIRAWRQGSGCTPMAFAPLTFEPGAAGKRIGTRTGQNRKRRKPGNGVIQPGGNQPQTTSHSKPTHNPLRKRHTHGQNPIGTVGQFCIGINTEL